MKNALESIGNRADYRREALEIEQTMEERISELEDRNLEMI